MITTRNYQSRRITHVCAGRHPARGFRTLHGLPPCARINALGCRGRQRPHRFRWMKPGRCGSFLLETNTQLAYPTSLSPETAQSVGIPFGRAVRLDDRGRVMQSLIKRVKTRQAGQGLIPAPGHVGHGGCKRLYADEADLPVRVARRGAVLVCDGRAGTILPRDEARARTAFRYLYAKRAHPASQQRPEFNGQADGNRTSVEGEPLAADVRARAVEFSDQLVRLRIFQRCATAITNLPGVKQASLRVKPGGVLQVSVQPRVPVACLAQVRTGCRLDRRRGRTMGQMRGHVASVRTFRWSCGESCGTYAWAKRLKLIRTAAPLVGAAAGLVRMRDVVGTSFLTVSSVSCARKHRPCRRWSGEFRLEGAEEVLKPRLWRG